MKRFAIFLLVVAVIGGTLLALSRGGSEEPAEAAQERETIPPVRAPGAVVADGRVKPVRSAALSFATGGIVAEVLVKEGQRVEAGQVLLRLDAARQRASLAQAEAQLKKAEAHLERLKAGPRPQEVEAARAAVDVARAQLARVVAGGAPLEVSIAEAELRRATAQLELLEAGERAEGIAAAEAEVAAARAALELARTALDETELRAPFAGVVASLAPGAGEFVAPGHPVVWLADDSHWLVETEDLTELAVVRIGEGSRARVRIDAIPGVELAGRVAAIKPMGENRLGDITYAVLIELEEDDPRLRWNMTASVTLGE